MIFSLVWIGRILIFLFWIATIRQLPILMKLVSRFLWKASQDLYPFEKSLLCKWRNIPEKGCHLYLIHAEDLVVGEQVHIEDYLILQELYDIFKEILGLPPKRDIDFAIDLIPGTTYVSKKPYWKGTLSWRNGKCNIRNCWRWGISTLVCHHGEHQLYS